MFDFPVLVLTTFKIHYYIRQPNLRKLCHTVPHIQFWTLTFASSAGSVNANLAYTCLAHYVIWQ